MRRRSRTLALHAAALAAAALLGGATAAGAAPAGTSCPPISAAQLHAILGLPSSLQTRNTVDSSGGADTYVCNGLAWSGTAPQSFQAGLQRARSGQAAGFGIEVWQPDGHECCWEDKRFPALRSRFLEGSLSLPGLLTSRSWPTKRIQPEGFGHAAVGIVTKVGSGPTKGLVAAIGCWWDSGAYTAACLFVEEAGRKPVVAHLNALAKIAVPKVL